MTKTTKRKTLLTSILMFFVFVFSLVFIGFADNIKAKAEDVTNGKYITVDSDTDATTEKGATLSFTAGEGLLVNSVGDSSSDNSYNMVGEYSGRINGVFSQADTNVIGLVFPNVSKPSSEFELTFKVEAVDGVGDYFLVKYYAQQVYRSSSNTLMGKIAVVYVDAETGEETFRASDFNGKVLHSQEEVDEVGMCRITGSTTYVDYVSLPTIGDANKTAGTFTLDWDNDGVLTVKAPLLKQGNQSTSTSNIKERTIATFNGDETDGLPKIAFEDGYKISFVSNSCQDVLFTQIGGTDLTTEATTPAWYQSDAADPSSVYSTATVMLDGKVQGAYPENKAISLPSARWLTNTDQGDASLTVVDAQDATVDPANGLAAGTYTAIYTGGATGVTGNEVRIPFAVKSDLFTAVNDAVASETGTVQTLATVGRHTGTLVSADGAYNGQINGVFTDGAKVEFLLPSIKNLQAKTFNLTFKVEDAADASNYFEIIYYFVDSSKTAGGSDGVTMVVKYVDNGAEQYRAYYYNKNNSTGCFGIVSNDAVNIANYKGSDEIRSVVQPGSNGRKSYFKLGFEGDVFCVYAPQTRPGTNAMYVNAYSKDVALAKFDGTSTVSTPVDFDSCSVDGTGNSYGLPKIAFDSGYKISFTSATKQSILFTEIAGDDAPVDLALDFADGGYPNGMPVWYSNYKAATETVQAEINGAALSLSTDIAVRFYVDADKLATYEESKFETTFNGATKELIAADETQTIDSIEYKVFTLYGIRPDQMGETITATLSGRKADEAELSTLDTLEYSVKTYCDNTLADADASQELKAVCAALLNYGSSAQQYTGVNSSTLVNPNYNAAPTAPTYTKTVTQTNTESDNLTWKGATMLLQDTISFKFYFKPAVSSENFYRGHLNMYYGKDADNDGKGDKAVEIYVGNDGNISYFDTETVNGEVYYYVLLENLRAEDLAYDITVEAKNNSGDYKAKILTYSVEAYANAMVNDSNTSNEMKNLSIYLMEYVNAVKAYVESLA